MYNTDIINLIKHHPLKGGGTWCKKTERKKTFFGSSVTIILLRKWAVDPSRSHTRTYILNMKIAQRQKGENEE